MGLCNEAHFARSHLKKTLSTLLEGSTQAKAALFCLKQIRSEDITEDLQIAFAKLLPHSLLHAENLPELTEAKEIATFFCVKQIQSEDISKGLRIAFAKLLPHLLLPPSLLPHSVLLEFFPDSRMLENYSRSLLLKLLPHSHLPHSCLLLPELRAAIQQLQTQHLIFRRLPVGTQEAITFYLSYQRSASGSGTASQTVLGGDLDSERQCKIKRNYIACDKRGRKLWQRGWICSLFRRK